ncbi:MAG: tetratricopeptide repeat protein [Phycisphaerales bacterium]|nr:tetratricopeptide repeat protein [Phycisphaerales bacterium]MCB9856675.1 tetratricopeptide repeat protein [Phycisphaerales bacterium]MCB9862198.1 tetratricopeptide repeat protein [Phycisphaerales bacterium]
MAKKLNKSLVGSLVVTLMVLLAAAGFVLVQNLPGSDPQLFVEEAKVLEKNGENVKAMRAYHRAYLKDDTKNPEYLVSAARCAIEAGEIGNARQFLSDALNNQPGYAPAHVQTLRLEMEIAKLFGGNIAWQRVLDAANTASNYPELQELAITNSAKGLALLTLSDTNPTYRDKGIEALHRASELDPTDVDTIRGLTRELWRNAKEKELKRNADDARTDMETAYAMVEAALKRAREDNKQKEIEEIEMIRAQLLLLDDKVDEARAALEKITEADMVDSAPLIALAMLYTGRVSKDIERDLDKSETYLKRALELDPASGAAYLNLGNIYEMQMALSEDPETKDLFREKQRDLYEEGLKQIKQSDHFRELANRNARVELVKSLFLADIRDAATATKDDDKNKWLAKAEEWLDQMKEEVPANSQIALYLDAELLNARGEVIQATRQGEAAMKAGNQQANVPLLRLMADLYSRQNQLGRVQEMLEQAIAAAPRNPDPGVYLRMGQVLLQQNRPAEALKYLKPDGPEGLRVALAENRITNQLLIDAYSRLGQPELAKQISDRISEGNTLEDKLRRVYMITLEKDYARAETQARALLDENPDNTNVLQVLIHVLQSAGKMDEARSVVGDLVARYPDNRDFRRFEIALAPPSKERDDKLLNLIASIEDEQTRNFEYAAYYRNHEDPAKEREYLDLAEKADPANPGIIELQFSLALRQSDWDRAQQYVDKFAEHDFDGAGGKIAQGRLALARGQSLRQAQDPGADRTLRESVELLRQGLDIYPSNSIAWTYLAQAYVILGDIEQAKNELQRALEINPTNGHAARMRAQIAHDENDAPATRRYLAVAERAMPNDDWVLRMRQVIREQDNPVEGIPGRVKARQDNPDDVSNIVMLARLYKDPKVAEYEKAEEAYRDALTKSPDDLGLLREVANFLASEDVNLPQEGEALLTEKLRNTDDKATKAILAVSLAEFYAGLDRYNTADRYYRMAMSFDDSANILSLAADFYRKAKRYDDSIAALDKMLAKPELDRTHAQNAQSRKIAALLAMNELDRAKAEIDSYVAAYPEDDQGMIYIGAWHRVAGDIKKAEEAFNEHLAKDPDNAVALWQRGQLYVLQNKYQLAIQDLQRAKAVKPTAFNFQHRILLADALIEVGRFDDAINELNDILKDDPTQDRVAQALIDAYMRVRPAKYQEAEDLIYRYMRTNPRDYQWPMLLGQLGDISRDIRKRATGYLKAAELSQNQPDAVRELFAALRAGNDAQGIIDYASQKITPTALSRVPTGLSDLAWAYHQKGDSARCIESFKGALSSAGDNFITYNQIIQDMLTTLGPEGAMDEMKRAAESDPSNLLKRRAMVHLLWMNKRIPEAIEVCDGIQKEAVRDGDLLFAHLSKGMLLTATNEPLKAKEEYIEALKIDPNHPMVLNNLSYLLAETLEMPKEALSYAKQASRLQPNNADILDTYGWIQALNGMLGEAAGTLLRALDIDGKHPDVLLHLARVHAMRGECDDAKRRLEYLRDDINKRINEGISPGDKQAAQAYLPKIEETEKLVDRDCGKTP